MNSDVPPPASRSNLQDLRDLLTTPDQHGSLPTPTRTTAQVFPGMTVLEEISGGRGGMGVVYRALDTSLDRIVAIKTPRRDLRHQNARSLFAREARSVAKLDHPAIVRIFSFNADYDPPYFVMQFVDGKPLDAACQGMEMRSIARILHTAASALAYAHDRGIVHRDIKPANILVDFSGKAYITDFGIAQHFTPSSRSTEDDALSGTPFYIAPEVYQGAAATPSSDIYALGVTMYRVLTGRDAFHATTLPELRAQVLEAAFPLPEKINPGVPEPLQRICLTAMEQDPAHRYPTSQHMAQDLGRFLEGSDVQAYPSRYRLELLGRLQSHIADIKSWQQQNLIGPAESEELLSPYSELLERASPFAQMSYQSHLESVLLRLGSWFALVGSLLLAVFYWQRLGSVGRIITSAFPAAIVNGLGIYLHRRRERLTSIVFLSTGAILFSAFVGVLLIESDVPTYRQPVRWELLGQASGDLIAITNAQLGIVSVCLCCHFVLLLLLNRSYWMALWVVIVAHVTLASVFLLLGAKASILAGHVAPVLAFALVAPASAAYIARQLVKAGHQPWADACYLFVPVSTIIILSLLAWNGSHEWLDAGARPDDTVLHMWLLGNCLAYFIIALVSWKSESAVIYEWGDFFLGTACVGVFITLHCLFLKGPLWETTDGNPLTAIQVLSILASINMIVGGTLRRSRVVTTTAALGFSTFIIRITVQHFMDYLPWPLLIMAAGLLLMICAATWRRLRPGNP